jgi:hypothetical protein
MEHLLEIVGGFIIGVGLAVALRVGRFYLKVRKEEKERAKAIMLSNRDRDRLLKIIEEAAVPDKCLLDAARRFKENKDKNHELED